MNRVKTIKAIDRLQEHLIVGRILATDGGYDQDYIDKWKDDFIDKLYGLDYVMELDLVIKFR